MTTQPTGQSIGPYAVVDMLGEGGMGQVLRCVDPKTGHHVAVKVLNPALMGNTKVVQRFERELQVMLALRSHPNIVTVLDYVSDPFALVMEMLAGETMHDRLQRSGGLPLDELYRFFKQILEAVDFAHEEGVLHRDIKSANVMLVRLGAQDHVKVMDFGLAGFVVGSQLTRAGTRMGTPAYMAPEQHLGGQITRMTDVYSLGALLFELATGVVPYPDTDTTTDYALMKQHIEAPIPLASSLRPGLPASVDEMVLRAMQKAASGRYPTCAAFLADLRNVERGVEVTYGLREAALEGDSTGTTRAFEIDPRLLAIDSTDGTETASLGPSPSDSLGPPDGLASRRPTGPPPTVLANDDDSDGAAAPRGTAPPPTILEDAGAVPRADDSSPATDDEPIGRPASTRTGAWVVAAMVAAVVALGLSVAFVDQPGAGSEGTGAPAAAVVDPGQAIGGEVAPAEPTPPAPAPAPPPAPTQLRLAFASATSSADPVKSKYGGHIEYDARQAIDGDPETWWQESESGDGIGQKLLLGIVTDGSMPLVHRLRVVPGYWKYKNDRYGDRWTLNNRVARAAITVGDRTLTHDFADSRGWHEIEVDPPVRADRVTLEILGVHPGGRDPKTRKPVRDTGFSEVQVWGTP